MDSLRRHKYAILLTTLVGVALIESFSHRLVLGPVLSDVLISTTLLLVFLIVFERWVDRLVAVIAVGTAVAIYWVRYVLPDSAELPLRLIYHSATLLLVGFAVIVTLRNIFEHRVARIDDVLGTVCGYLLAAAAWANLFLLIEIFFPGSFSVGPGFSARLDTWNGRIALLNYVSLGSLTSVGSGEVVAVRPPATMLTTLEAMFGQFYIAVVVAQLVGARISHGLQRNGSPRD